MSAAGVPSHATRPFSSTQARSASGASSARFLSMTSSACPSALSPARHFQISARTSGARPSVASSRTSRRGLVISARPTASICCSPPDSVPARWLCARRSVGKSRSTRSSVQGCDRRSRRGRWRRGSRAPSAPGTPAGPRERGRCRPARSGTTATPCTGVPSKHDAPARDGHEPDDRAHRGRLAHAVAAQQRQRPRRGAARTRRRTAPGSHRSNVSIASTASSAAIVSRPARRGRPRAPPGRRGSPAARRSR